MTTNILTMNAHMLHKSTYRPLTPDEIADKDMIDTLEQCMARAHEKLVSWVLPRELEDIGLENTPQYNLHGNEIQNDQSFPHSRKNLSPQQTWQIST